MIKTRPKYPTDLYGTIYIDNIQKGVVICLIIRTIFPFDAGSSIKRYLDVWRTLSTLDPESKGNVGMIRQMTAAFWILSSPIHTWINTKWTYIILYTYIILSEDMKNTNKKQTKTKYIERHAGGLSKQKYT